MTDPGTRYLDGVPEGGALVEQYAAAEAPTVVASIPADVAEARSADTAWPDATGRADHHRAAAD